MSDIEKIGKQKFSTVTLRAEVPNAIVAGLLVSAFEGGSNYWYRIKGFKKPTGPLFVDHTYKNKDGTPCVFRHYQYPMSPGGVVIIEDMEDDGKTYRLTEGKLMKGLQAFAEESPERFARCLREDYDAIDGDIFLQCCLFGKSIYG